MDGWNIDGSTLDTFEARDVKQLHFAAIGAAQIGNILLLIWNFTSKLSSLHL